MDWRERIVCDPEILAGKAVVRGTRISAALILGLLANGWDEQQVLEEYPTLSQADLRACLAYAATVLHDTPAPAHV